MAIIRDPSVLIGALEQGQLHKDLAEKIQETITKLQDLTGDNAKAKAKGSVTIKLDICVQDGRIEFDADVTTKTPKPPRRSTVYFLTEDAEISTVHPRQHDMFSGPNAVPTRETA
ncbi:hypothetical protein GOZ94_00665 [Agrobacterium vitis]|uniref:hypothetical protein n=1 Tax=Agrobacterium vitis TaxID=373 RepID=UPI0012E7D4DC|nr:hypothetical protein [Agrobacterium vitis]MVA17457.1 hypothetical protein [Agrobacterium vitis]